MTISTPCIRVCQLDEETGLCLGCGRTRQEIACWGAMSEDARLAVMAGLPARLDALEEAAGAPPRAAAVGQD